MDKEHISSCWYKDVCSLEECPKFCIRYAEMSHLMSTSGIPVSRQNPVSLYPDDIDYNAFVELQDIKDNIDGFVDGGMSLYIASKNFGNGKTTWAIKLMLKFFDKIWAGNGFRTRGLFVHVPTFLLKCKDFKNHDEEFEEFKQNLMNVDLVIWDDIASTDISSYDYSQLLSYIDQRVLINKSNIYTGNFDSKELLRERLGSKLTSRIWSDRNIVVLLRGGDKR